MGDRERSEIVYFRFKVTIFFIINLLSKFHLILKIFRWGRGFLGKNPLRKKNLIGRYHIQCIKGFMQVNVLYCNLCDKIESNVDSQGKIADKSIETFCLKVLFPSLKYIVNIPFFFFFKTYLLFTVPIKSYAKHLNFSRNVLFPYFIFQNVLFSILHQSRFLKIFNILAIVYSSFNVHSKEFELWHFAFLKNSSETYLGNYYIYS